MHITHQRARDYWAANLPVNRGRYNFDSIHMIIISNDKVALEAFMRRRYDFRIEPSPEELGHPASGRHRATTSSNRTRPNQAAQTPAGWRSTSKKPLFADLRVREAITGFRL